MADEKLQELDIDEQEAIGKALVLILKKNPTIAKKKIGVQFEGLETNRLGLFTQQGTVYLKKFISGTFTAQYNFFLRYRIKPTTDEQKVNAEEMLNAIAMWLEREIEYPELTDGRKIDSIARTSQAFMADMAQDGEVDFQTYLSLQYTRRKT